ncbi:hypothetical protein BN2497_9379 [Janthinobacterium sp. CG23_2]|nr:hypothetical protein BN2497_9379 [Janthinobacterium sp. CG23_2]CUU31087.1 hypothetical protein BN3177_9379 [Janthinobacterium sp. CG23_2]
MILGAGTLIPVKKLEAYPLGCKMRNTITALYNTIPVS